MPMPTVSGSVGIRVQPVRAPLHRLLRRVRFARASDRSVNGLRLQELRKRRGV